MNRASRVVGDGWKIRRIDSRIAWTLGFVAVLAFYLATTPENRTEATDGYTYAIDVEGRALTDMFDARHLLFLVAMRLLYRAAHAIHDGVTGHGVLLSVSALSASLGLVLFARLLNRHFGLSLASSLLGAGFLGASYGYWRYSVEAEIYAPSLFLVLAVVSLVFAVEDNADRARGWRVLLPAGVLAGLAVIFYQLNAIPLFLALPVLLLLRGSLPRLIGYGTAGGSVILLGYVAAFLLDQMRFPTVEAIYTFVFDGFDQLGSTEGLLASVAMTVVAMGHVVVSGNWAFGLHQTAAAMDGVMSLPIADKRVFAASKASILNIYIPMLTLAMLLVLGIYTILVAVRSRRHAVLDRRTVFALSWIAPYAILKLWLNPYGYELWIMTLPPLVIIFATFVVEPCVRERRGAIPTVLLATFVLHNAIGGIGIVYGAGGDYYSAKAAWLLDNATTDDLIVMPADQSFKSFLCYRGGLRVMMISNREICLRGEERNISDLIEVTRRGGGRIFVFDEFFDSPAAWRIQRKPDPEALDVAERFRDAGQSIFQSDAGTTYQLR